MRRVTVKVLLVGLTGSVVEAARQQVEVPDVEGLGATGINDVREVFGRMKVDHVVMGAGLDLADRIEIVHEVFTLSDETTVHMKDRASGPDGFLPFVRSLVTALA